MMVTGASVAASWTSYLAHVRRIVDCRVSEILEGHGQAVGTRLAVANAEYLGKGLGLSHTILATTIERRKGWFSSDYMKQTMPDPKRCRGPYRIPWFYVAFIQL